MTSLHGRPAAAAGVVLALLGAGCGSVLEVESPDIVDPDKLLESAAGLEALRGGAFGDFGVAMSGVGGTPGNDGHVQVSGLITDEIRHSGTQSNRTALDARVFDERNTDIDQLYTRLHRARRAAEFAASTFTAQDPSQSKKISELLSLAGFTYVLLGEDFCSGVAFSDVDLDGNIQFGQPQTTDQVFALAGQLFDDALAQATTAGDATMQNLARVGKGRALLNQGQFAAAAQAVTSVPTGFVYQVKYSTNTNRQNNAVANNINDDRRLSVINKEGVNGIDYFDANDAGDPRTPYNTTVRKGFDTSIQNWGQFKYGSRESPITLADGIEARMIEAEAALQASAMGTFESMHNAARATKGLAAISTTGMTQAQIVDLHFRERALWFWLTGHRLGDLRRLARQYGRTADSVFPTGVFHKAVYPTYGTGVALPLPFSERNNPNSSGCLDLNP